MTDKYEENYFDPRTGVLFNTLDIADSEELRSVEKRLVLRRANEALLYARTCAVPDAECLKGVHRILFQDIYSWAGRFRTMPISKGTTKFLRDGLEEATNMAAQRFVGRISDRPEHLASILAGYWAEANYIHPFVEGNGRTTQIVVTSLAQNRGYAIEWREISRENELAAAKESCAPFIKGFPITGYMQILEKALRPLSEHEREPLLFIPSSERG